MSLSLPLLGSDSKPLLVGRFFTIADQMHFFQGFTAELMSATVNSYFGCLTSMFLNVILFLLVTTPCFLQTKSVFVA
jgi:hypothetical protein